MKKYAFIAVLGILFSTQCRASEWQPLVTTADLFLWRPITLAETVAGSALWLVSLPVTVPSKTHGDALDLMVKKPYRWTFKRPLAKISD